MASSQFDGTEYHAYEDAEEVLRTSDVTRDIAVMMNKAMKSASVPSSSSLDNLPSHALLVPEIGRASDFARPGGFRRQHVAGRLAAGQKPGDLIDFYSAFAASVLSIAQIDRTAPATPRLEAATGRKTIGVAHTVLAILKSFVGSAVLFLPKGYDNGGLILSNMLLMLMAAITVFCVGRLLDCAQTLKRHGLQDCTYSEIAFVSMGRMGARAVDISLVLSQASRVARVHYTFHRLAHPIALRTTLFTLFFSSLLLFSPSTFPPPIASILLALASWASAAAI